MKYMGIDYGARRVGIALSDMGGTIAFPRVVLINSSKLLSEILALTTSESVDEIVVGKSLDTAGNRNTIMDDIDAFAEELEKLSGKPVRMQNEQFTSHFLKSFDFTKSIEKPISRNRTNGKKKTDIDAQAAASILQRYLEGK